MSQLWIWIVLLAVAVVAVVLVAFWAGRRSSNPSSSASGDSVALVPADEPSLMSKEGFPKALVISIPVLPAAMPIEEKRLSLISDGTVIERLNQAIPAAAEAAAKTLGNRALKNAEVYKAVIPSGARLAKSKEVQDAVRGIYHGADGIKGHANLVRVDMSKTAAVAGGVANVMNAASLVVGQYYMAEIDNKLEKLTSSVGAIGDFQQSEFKSRVISLIAHVAEISQFSSTIMEDEIQRRTKTDTLEHLRREATELLGQVNITIDGIREKHPVPKYEEYRASTNELAIQLGYQNALVVVLQEISKLTYLLGRGTIPSEQTRFLLDKYVEQSEQTKSQLRDWHDHQVERLHIDLAQERRDKTGFDAVLAAPLGLFDGKYKYRQLQAGLAQEIGTQKATPALQSADHLEDVYDDDVEIVIKDGSYYYLHGIPGKESSSGAAESTASDI